MLVEDGAGGGGALRVSEGESSSLRSDRGPRQNNVPKQAQLIKFVWTKQRPGLHHVADLLLQLGALAALPLQLLPQGVHVGLLSELPQLLLWNTGGGQWAAPPTALSPRLLGDVCAPIPVAPLTPEPWTLRLEPSGSFCLSFSLWGLAKV